MCTRNVYLTEPVMTGDNRISKSKKMYKRNVDLITKMIQYKQVIETEATGYLSALMDWKDVPFYVLIVVFF